jgi:glycosyltransferase involved in cell wall biosynthesis
MPRIVVRGWQEYAKLWGGAIQSALRWDVDFSNGDFSARDTECDFIFCNGRDRSERKLLDLLKNPRHPTVIFYVHDIPLEEWTERWGVKQKSWPSDVQRYFDILRRCDKVLTQSTFMVDRLKELGVENVARMDMCLDSQAMSRWSTLVDREPALLDTWSYSYVSRIVRLKGQLDLIYALNKLGKTKKVVLAGRKFDRGYLVEILKEASGKQRLTWGVDVPNSWVYQMSRFGGVAVAPSRFEGWGMFPARCWWFGTPLILYDIPVFTELYADYATFVPVGNIAALAEALEFVWRNYIKIRTESIVKSLQAKERWSEQQFGQRFERLVNGKA